MNLIDVTRDFPTEEACLEYLENVRWPKGVSCLKCGGSKVSAIKSKDKRTKARKIYQCLTRPCRHQFTATTGTIFHGTRIPLRKWFMAIALTCDAKKGLSAKQLERHLGVQYRTAWYLAHRIRKAMEESPAERLGASGKTVEVDETYIGGKYDKRRLRRRYRKQAVMGLIERGGRIETHKVPETQKRVLVGVVKSRVAKSARVITDEHGSYRSLGKTFKQHDIINHIQAYVRDGDIHTNTIENFWSLLKRGIIGSYHKVSIKHLDRYLGEFVFRFNNRHAANMFLMVLIRLLIQEGIRYKELTANNRQ